ncbi:MAG: Gfo/Idh/MocA family oxidoreductase [Flavobacteriaceae bacterium]
MEKEIRWGIAGLGNIAHKFAEELVQLPGCRLMGVGSRNYEKASSFAQTYNVPFYFGSYDELFRSEEVDVVYIATPHNSHADISIGAMNAGKHVLCEKPLAVNRKEALEMVKVAKDKNVFLMEALWTRFNPSILKVLDRIESGDIGKLAYVKADFAFYALDKEEEGRLLNPELAGGSILDIGIYPIFLAYLLLGMPDKIFATSNFYKTGAEIQTSMIFSYQEAQAILYSGLNSNSEMKAEISGTEGTIYLDPRWHHTQGYTLDSNGQQDHYNHPTIGMGYTYEIKEVNSCLRQGKTQSKLWSLQNSLDMLELMDEVRAKSKVVFPFEG